MHTGALFISTPSTKFADRAGRQVATARPDRNPTTHSTSHARIHTQRTQRTLGRVHHECARRGHTCNQHVRQAGGCKTIPAETPPTCDTGPTLDNVRARVRACVRACEDNALSHAKPMRCVPGRAVSAERMSDRATRVSFHHTCQCQEAPHTSENGLGPYVSDVPCGI